MCSNSVYGTPNYRSAVLQERKWILLVSVSKTEGLKMPYEEVAKENTDRKWRRSTIEVHRKDYYKIRDIRKNCNICGICQLLPIYTL